MTPALILTLGLAVGLQHAFEPDHISAVTTQILKRKHKTLELKQLLKEGTFKSSILGALWGAGHTTTLIIIGLLLFVFSINIPSKVFLGFEMIVGIMLVILAITTFSNKKLFKLKHSHPHIHTNGTLHIHPHNHGGEHKHSHKSYLIGCIHGLAGSGSIVILTASTLGDLQTVLSFIIIFGIGSVIGMTIISGLIGLPFVLTNKFGSASKTLRYIACTATLLIGINIIYEIGLSENLFGI
ncbi:MAG: high frequency lysogenization protein HflD [Nitrosopumilaceae archaeon]